MKIYHTETQADYDALMVELKEQGCKWLSGRKPTKATTNWKPNSSETCVKVDKKAVVYAGKSFYTRDYPNIPIIKYKAKADEKMRFTKENVSYLFREWKIDEIDTMQDLEREIIKLEAIPEKVVVPKCFDEWYKEIKAKHQRPDNAKRFALWKLCQKGFGYSFERANGEKIHHKSELGEWLNRNTFLAIDAVLNGYTIEPEKFYYIPLPHLKTSDGLQQVLSKRKNDKNYFAWRPTESVQQRYTKEELERVPEVYKPYAKPIEEEESEIYEREC